MKLTQFFEAWWSNGATRGIRVGRFAGPFYVCVLRGIRSAWGFSSNGWPVGTFRWHIHLRIGRDTFAPTVPRQGIVKTWVIA